MTSHYSHHKSSIQFTIQIEPFTTFNLQSISNLVTVLPRGTWTIKLLIIELMSFIFRCHTLSWASSRALASDSGYACVLVYRVVTAITSLFPIVISFMCCPLASCVSRSNCNCIPISYTHLICVLSSCNFLKSKQRLTIRFCLAIL